MAAATGGTDKIRVVVAEDSLTVRELLVAILESDPGIIVVGQAKNGMEAVALAERLRPSVITMDIEMPVLNGLEATKEIMVRAPTPIVMVSASNSRPHVQRLFDAVRAGALTVLEKPEDPRSSLFNGRRDRFVATVKAMAQVKVVRRRIATATTPSTRWPPDTRFPQPGEIKVVVIGASTGGPAALRSLLGELPRDFPVPVLLVQHIAAGFVAGLGEWLAANCDLHVKVAEDGERLLSRTVYMAPDNRHLGIGENDCVRLLDTAPIGSHRPSADVLFETAAAAYSDGVLGVVLSGMGNDGARGAGRIKDRGGWLLAQDEHSSAVYGMNREVILGGRVDQVLAPEALGATIARLVMGGDRNG